MILHGIAASAGIGLGRVFILRERGADYAAVRYSGRDKERERLRRAVERFNEQTASMAARLGEQAGAEAADILAGQIAMLADPFLLEQIQEAIDGGSCAEAAADGVLSQYAAMFDNLEDALMRQRAADVRDIRARLLELLLGAEGTDLGELPQDCVLTARDLTPSMTVGLRREWVAAILTAAGGWTSHAAILARAMEIPAVLGIGGLLGYVRDGDGVIVDGEAGTALLHPDASAWEAYLARRETWLIHRERRRSGSGRETVDADGKRYRLCANIGSPVEAAAAARAGAEGVGLFRTELLFMNRDGLPGEEEQYEAYRAVSRAMEGREVVIRTLDAGGDKAIECLGMDREETSLLGLRGVRLCLDRRELFKSQLRALLRAGAERRNIKIMLPMVTSPEEVGAVRALLDDCKGEQATEGTPYDGDIALGAMIETPAAALCAGTLAGVCDFFSIGTNDLTQYVMAADRGCAALEGLSSCLQPAVLRAVRMAAEAAKGAGIPVGMCGEAAADPRMVPLLISWGMDSLSVSVSALGDVRAAFARWTGAEARRVEEEVMGLTSAAEVERCLRSHGPGQ